MLTGAETIELMLLRVVSTVLVDVGNKRPDVDVITGLFDPMTVSVGAELLTTDVVEVDFVAC